MCDINFNRYGDEEFFTLFLDAIKETYGEYCTFKEREENLSGYSEPVFEKSIEEADLRITSIVKIIPKVTNEAAQHKITADYAKRHLEQCEAALSAEQNKREEVEQQLAKANERVSELEKQFETQMTNDFVTTTDQAKRITELEKYNLDLANESHKYQERCAELEKELANKDLLHVGFTNGAQIKYAKDEEGAFYPDTDGDCYIPLYMLKSHEHRIETTSIEQLLKEQE